MMMSAKSGASDAPLLGGFQGEANRSIDDEQPNLNQDFINIQ